MSTTLPLTLPARASLAKRLPIDAATSATVAPSGTSRFDPSGSSTCITFSQKQTGPIARPCRMIFVVSADHRHGGGVSVVRVSVVEVRGRIVVAEYNNRDAETPFPRPSLLRRGIFMKNSLVICCDGTWNSADQVTKDGNPCVTNVLKLAVRTKKIKSDGSLQIVYYDQGVGTGNAADRLLGGAFGDGLVGNVIDAYRFLIANYDPGDDIYIFGLSRGAYTARCIAGMVRRCGILKRESVRKYVEAQRIYRTAKTADAPEAVAFRKENAIEDDTPIRCIGVWDTVGALGIPLQAFQMLNKQKYEFLDVHLTRAATFAFQALAVDEHRRPFEPSLWD